jgi:hypothetical protein
MKKRIPFDVQFLMESILSEDPDEVTINRDDVSYFINKGAKIKNKVSLGWKDSDAITFYIDSSSRIVVFSDEQTHNRMEAGLNLASRFVVYPEGMKNKCEPDELHGCVGLFFLTYPDIGIYFYNLKDNTDAGLVEYLKQNRLRLKDIEIRGSEETGKTGSTHAKELCGRLWKNGKVISFWNDKSKIDPYMNLILGFMRKLGLSPQEFVYEFIDVRGQIAYDELSLPIDQARKKTDAEKQELLSKKHFNKNKEDFGKEFWAKHKKMAAKGFDYPAKADAAIPALENRKNVTS